MSREKILRNYERKIHYSADQWTLFEKKREQAQELLSLFEKEGLHPYVYGSIARGDVHELSDIDIVFLDTISPFQIEITLKKNSLMQYHREILMATPADSVKLYIHLSELESLTLPLTKLTRTEQEFYDFGGKIDLKELLAEQRVPGIDKRLVLIQPTSYGHYEQSILNRKSIAAKVVGVSTEIVKERIAVLLRREEHGRTGVFLKEEIPPHTSTEQAIKNLKNSNSIIRKKLSTY
ncbi:MAG: nucleotidyltransferase domain-containing protein [Promethearchaeia archaeon]